MIILPNTDTTVWDGDERTRKRITAGNESRVGGSQIDSDGSVGHYSGGLCGWGPAGMNADGGLGAHPVTAVGHSHNGKSHISTRPKSEARLIDNATPRYGTHDYARSNRHLALPSPDIA